MAPLAKCRRGLRSVFFEKYAGKERRARKKRNRGGAMRAKSTSKSAFLGHVVLPHCSLGLLSDGSSPSGNERRAAKSLGNSRAKDRSARPNQTVASDRVDGAIVSWQNLSRVNLRLRVSNGNSADVAARSWPESNSSSQNRFWCDRSIIYICSFIKTGGLGQFATRRWPGSTKTSTRHAIILHDVGNGRERDGDALELGRFVRPGDELNPYT